MIRLLICDDHKLFREGILSLLEHEEDITIVGEAEDGLSMIENYNESKPDIILSDISMPKKNGPDAVKIITSGDTNIKVLFLSQYTGDDYIFSVLESGGSGLISKNVMRSELVFAIKTVANGGKYFVGKTENELEELKKRFSTIKRKVKISNVDLLTKKEKEILMLVSQNLSSKQIADKLEISIRTVDSHRLNIINKLHLRSLPGLISFAKDYALENEKSNNE